MGWKLHFSLTCFNSWTHKWNYSDQIHWGAENTWMLTSTKNFWKNFINFLTGISWSLRRICLILMCRRSSTFPTGSGKLAMSLLVSWKRIMNSSCVPKSTASCSSCMAPLRTKTNAKHMPDSSTKCRNSTTSHGISAGFQWYPLARSTALMPYLPSQKPRTCGEVLKNAFTGMEGCFISPDMETFHASGQSRSTAASRCP